MQSNPVTLRIVDDGTSIGAEPVVDPRKDTAYLMWGRVRLVSLVVEQAFNNELMSQLLGKTAKLR